uniref:Uncharacterized protein n=1 Tax=Mycena chlorophos TaxID=658473 RepID=A0ABQ0LGP8_MYCCL|nr:predicted protein [Mycena chlorophos]
MLRQTFVREASCPLPRGRRPRDKPTMHAAATKQGVRESEVESSSTSIAFSGAASLTDPMPSPWTKEEAAQA